MLPTDMSFLLFAELTRERSARNERLGVSRFDGTVAPVDTRRQVSGSDDLKSSLSESHDLLGLASFMVIGGRPFKDSLNAL